MIVSMRTVGTILFFVSETEQIVKHTYILDDRPPLDRHQSLQDLCFLWYLLI